MSKNDKDKTGTRCIMQYHQLDFLLNPMFHFNSDHHDDTINVYAAFASKVKHKIIYHFAMEDPTSNTITNMMSINQQ